MKAGEKRRALLAATLAGGLLLAYLCWRQQREPPRPPRPQPAASAGSEERPPYRPEAADADDDDRPTGPPRWTWQCSSQRCERRPYAPGPAPPVPLSTCGMLCGSTQLWPQPTGPVTLGSRAVHFRPSTFVFKPAIGGPAAPLLREAWRLFNESVAGAARGRDCPAPAVDGFVVAVTVKDGSATRLRLDTDESYALAVKMRGREVVANVTARTFFGARHALETLAQLIWWDEYEGCLKVVKGATVQDAPAFPYRGLMVDTSRNFMSVQSLKRVLVGMAASKLNVFHWHATDSQSFPLVLPNVPQLAEAGAYAPRQTYKPQDVRDLVDFARVRGIRVVLEVDTPAHAGNGWTWGPSQGLGELAVCVNERPWSLYCGEPPCGQLNPENPNVYDVLEKMYKDLLEMTGEDEIFHLGGDEVNLECWAQHLQKTNNLYNYTDLHDLWGEFTLKALGRLQAANGGKKVPNVIVWSSKLSKRPYVTKYLDKDSVVVQSWGASQWPDTPDLVADGYRVVVSHVDAWYLDCGFGRWRETGDAACDPYRPWQTVYNHRPWQQLRLDRGRILGGEACVWTEQVHEESLDARLWPRAAAFAERVWADPPLDAVTFSIQEDVYTRLDTHRRRLVGRGLRAEALWPTWCSQNPGMCL